MTAALQGSMLSIPGLLLTAVLAFPAPAPTRSAATARPVTSPSVASDTIRGQVTDADGAPVEGAEVAIPELRRQARTGGDGAFRIADVPPGDYTVVVTRAGYGSRLSRVSAPGAPLRLSLRAEPFSVPALTVTATRSPIATLASPLAVSALGQEALRRRSEVSLAQTLERLPGVRTLATGSQIGKPVLRGLSGARVLVLDAGNRLEDYSWSDEDGPSIDARTADRVEVVRGPASVLYGPDAVGGVVNVIPEEVPDPAGGASFTRSTVEAYGATNNREVGGTVQLEGAGRGLGWRVAGIGRFAEDLHTPTGPLENTGYFAVNGEAAVGKRGPWGAATLRYARYGGEFRLLEAAPGAQPQPAAPGEEEGPVRKLADDRVQLEGTFPLRGVRLDTHVQFQRHWLAEVSDEAGAPAGGKEQTAFELTLNTLSGDLAAHHQLGGRVRGAVGASGFLQTHDSRGPITLVPDAHGAAAGAYLFEEATLGVLSLSGGARADLRSLSAAANPALATAETERAWQAVSADVGAVLRIANGVALRANLGRAWRAPTLFELFANGPLLSDARYVLGDARLGAERGTSLDGGVRVERATLRAELSAFRISLPGYIFLEPQNELRQGLRLFRQVQARALLWGMDGSLALEPGRRLGLRASGDWVRARNRATGEPLPLTPAPRATLEAELKGSSPWRNGRSWLTVGSELVAKQTRLAPTDVPTAAYALLELGGGLEGRVGGRATRLDLRLSNALNARYADFLSRYKEFALNPGRSLTLRLGTEF